MLIYRIAAVFYREPLPRPFNITPAMLVRCPFTSPTPLFRVYIFIAVLAQTFGFVRRNGSLSRTQTSQLHGMNVVNKIEKRRNINFKRATFMVSIILNFPTPSFQFSHLIIMSRVLLQRALRLNGQEKKLWREYFRLELLYLEKVQLNGRV